MRPVIASLLAPLAIACGGSFPAPAAPPVPPRRSMVEVPEPPPAPRVEIVTPKPHAHAVWVDGAWEWEGERWKWDDGGWFLVPRGVYFAEWITQRKPDGTLLYGNAEWVDARGMHVDAPQRLSPAPSAGTGQGAGT